MWRTASLLVEALGMVLSGCSGDTPLGVGTWTITGGTDAHEGLSGSSDVLVDFDAGTVEYSGEISR